MKTLSYLEWANKVIRDTKYTLNEILDFKDHYQNLLSYEDNLKNFKDYLVE